MVTISRRARTSLQDDDGAPASAVSSHGPNSRRFAIAVLAAALTVALIALADGAPRLFGL